MEPDEGRIAALTQLIVEASHALRMELHGAAVTIGCEVCTSAGAGLREKLH